MNPIFNKLQRLRYRTTTVTGMLAGALVALTLLPAQPSVGSPLLVHMTSASTSMHFPIQQGDSGDEVTALQKRLTWAGLTVAETGTFDKATTKQVIHLQEKFLYDETGIVDSDLWDTLVTITKSHGKLPKKCTSAKKILCISKKQKILRFMVDGKVVRILDARFGPEDEPALRTVEGMFQVNWKDKDHVSSDYHTPMPYTMNFYRGQAVHYSKYFARDGYYGNSHGCVNVRDKKAIAYVYNHTPVGTPVYIYK
jgi:peptidoglycan hydrolase-like protein with peptidoglycan-binding domain